jgi:hypothetical protein
MSSALAIGACSAVLRNLLDNGLIEAVSLGTTVKVSALAPDQVKLDRPQDPPQLNLFLLQATPNAAWRNRELPSRASGGERLTNPPLALDLTYLVTAYGKADFQAEILLGYAMQLLHERPVLDRAAVRRALNSAGALDWSMLPPEYQLLSAADLAEQVEVLRITPMATSLDELSKVWSALQSVYRPTAMYQVSVVLIEAQRALHGAQPVLTRGVRVQPDTGPALPTLLAVALPAKQIVARLGETVTVRGAQLAGSGATALLTHRLVDTPIELPVSVNDAGTAFDLALPNTALDQARFAPGLWQLQLRVTPPGEALPRTSNGIGLALAADPVLVADPGLGLPAATATRAGAPPVVTVTLRTRPQVQVAQTVSLSLDAFTATAKPRPNAADPLVFTFADALPAGTRHVTLRVDGIDSPLVRRGQVPPDFDPSQRLTVPA